jgi:hypothetical protein
MQIRTGRNLRRHSGVVVLAAFSALGLASACLNPAISDELPISESLAAIGSPDAGLFEPSPDEASPDVASPDEPSPDTEPSPSAPQPPRVRRVERTRNPTRR